MTLGLWDHDLVDEALDLVQEPIALLLVIEDGVSGDEVGLLALHGPGRIEVAYSDPPAGSTTRGTVVGRLVADATGYRARFLEDGDVALTPDGTRRRAYVDFRAPQTHRELGWSDGTATLDGDTHTFLRARAVERGGASPTVIIVDPIEGFEIYVEWPQPPDDPVGTWNPADSAPDRLLAEAIRDGRDTWASASGSLTVTDFRAPDSERSGLMRGFGDIVLFGIPAGGSRLEVTLEFAVPMEPVPTEPAPGGPQGTRTDLPRISDSHRSIHASPRAWRVSSMPAGGSG